MDAVVLDTDVFSYINKPTDPRGEIYRKRVQGKLLAVSFVTVGELLFGAYKANWGTAKLEALKERLRSVVIVPYDLAICQTYADLRSRLEKSGRQTKDNDLWIAACAVRHSIPLATNNRAHFEGIPSLILICETAVINQMQSQGEISFEEPKDAE